MSSSLASRERQQDSHDAIHAGQQLFGKEFRSVFLNKLMNFFNQLFKSLNFKHSLTYLKYTILFFFKLNFRKGKFKFVNFITNKSWTLFSKNKTLKISIFHSLFFTTRFFIVIRNLFRQFHTLMKSLLCEMCFIL